MHKYKYLLMACFVIVVFFNNHGCYTYGQSFMAEHVIWLISSSSIDPLILDNSDISRTYIMYIWWYINIRYKLTLTNISLFYYKKKFSRRLFYHELNHKFHPGLQWEMNSIIISNTKIQHKLLQAHFLSQTELSFFYHNHKPIQK